VPVTLHKPKAAFRLTASRRLTKGLSLIEMLIALLVVAVGLLGMAGLQAYSLKSNTSAYHRSLANSLAYEILDCMRANRSEAIAPDSKYNAITLGSTAGDFGESSRYEKDAGHWLSAIAYFLPGGEGEVACDTNNVCRVTVRWNDNRNIANASPQDLTVSTRL
jgi:type IV pilus assembly protein PilV